MDFELIQIALRIANDVHNGQVDLDGKAMLLHPLKVVLMGNSFDEMLVGILHDVVEDSTILLITYLNQVFLRM